MQISCKSHLCILQMIALCFYACWSRKITCVDASFLLQDCFLLLVAHILGSVVELNCKDRILGQRGKEQEKKNNKQTNFKSNLISF